MIYTYKQLRRHIIPRDMWLQVKIKSGEHPKIKALRDVEGLTFAAIATIYKVSPQLIRVIYWGIKSAHKSNKPRVVKNAINKKSFSRHRLLFELGLLPLKDKPKIVVYTH